jgi:hypothetical protein
VSWLLLDILVTSEAPNHQGFLHESDLTNDLTLIPSQTLQNSTWPRSLDLTGPGIS